MVLFLVCFGFVLLHIIRPVLQHLKTLFHKSITIISFLLLSCFLCFSFSVSLSHFLPIFINHSRSQEPGAKCQEPGARSQEPGQKAKAKRPKTLEIRHVSYSPSLFQLCTDIDLTFQWATLFWQNFRLIIYLDSFPFPVILTEMKNIYARAEVRRVKKNCENDASQT